MPAKKLKKSSSQQTAARNTDGKPAKNTPPKPAGKPIPVKELKPTVKSGGEVSGLQGGFIRINDSRIRKVYR